MIDTSTQPGLKQAAGGKRLYREEQGAQIGAL